MSRQARPSSDTVAPSSAHGRSRSRKPQREAQAEADRPEGPGNDGGLVTKGNSSARVNPWTSPDGGGQSPASIAPSTKRLMADRSRALIAESCGDMPEASKIAACGNRIRYGVSDVAVEHHPKGYAFATGLQTCGSVWSCPICSYKIRIKRAAEIALAIARHRANGGSVLLLTLTTQHSFDESLDDVWSSVQDTWAYITSHGSYRKLRDRLGIGFVRTIEVMHGRNGWHPHLHVLLFVDSPVDPFDTPEDYNDIARTFHDLWVRRMDTKHCRDVRSSVGVDLRPVKDDGADGVGMYCTKAGFEVALADGKQGRTRTSRHPFAIAHDAAETGDVADIKLYREWIRGSHDRRMWSWSQGLRQKLRLGVERSDEELAAEAEESSEQICSISPLLWKAIVATRIGLRSRFLTVLDDGPARLAAAVELLLANGVQVVVDRRSSGIPRLRGPDEPTTQFKPKETVSHV